MPSIIPYLVSGAEDEVWRFGIVANVEMLPIANTNVANWVGSADIQILEAGTTGLEIGTGNTGNIGNNSKLPQDILSS